MHSHRPRPSRRRLHGATLASVLTAVLALLLGTVGTASVAPQPAGGDQSSKEGQAYMGVGQEIHGAPEANPPAGIGIQDHGSGVQGIDVSHWQGGINWGAVRNSGIQFA